MSNAIQIATTSAAVVNVTPATGWFSDTGLTVPVVFPAVITGPTTYYTGNPGSYTVSAQRRGREYLGGSVVVRLGATTQVIVPPRQRDTAVQLVTDPRLRTDKTLPAAVVASNGWLNPILTLNATAGTGRSRHVIACDCTDIRLVYTNYVALDPSIRGVDTDGPGTYTIKACIELGGVKYRVTFGGAQTATIDPGGTIKSDPIALEFAANSLLYVDTYQAATSYYATGVCYSGNGSSGFGGFTATTDLTAPGSSAVADSTAYIYQPSAILGTPIDRDVASTVIIGDSIANGQGELGGPGADTFNGVDQGGFVTRGLRLGSVGVVNLAHPGEAVQNAVVAANHFRRHALISGATHVVEEMGVNDIYANGRTLAQFQADKITLWSYISRRGAAIWTTTLTPETASADKWVTLANQTASTGNAIRVAYNDWLRAGAPIVAGVAVAVGTPGALLLGQMGHPVAGYFEIADLAESSRDSGIWSTASVRTVTDGAITSGSNSLVSTQAVFSPADVGKGVAIVGAGAAGVTGTWLIKQYNSATQVLLNGNANTTVAAAATSIGVPTLDGTHPTSDMHRILAAGISVAQLLPAA